MKRRGDSVKICKYAIKRKPPDATLRVSSPSFPPLLPSPLLLLVSFSFLNDDPLRSRDYAKFQHEVPCVRFHWVSLDDKDKPRFINWLLLLLFVSSFRSYTETNLSNLSVAFSPTSDKLPDIKLRSFSIENERRIENIRQQNYGSSYLVMRRRGAPAQGIKQLINRTLIRYASSAIALPLRVSAAPYETDMEETEHDNKRRQCRLTCVKRSVTSEGSVVGNCEKGTEHTRLSVNNGLVVRSYVSILSLLRFSLSLSLSPFLSLSFLPFYMSCRISIRLYELSV